MQKMCEPKLIMMYLFLFVPLKKLLILFPPIIVLFSVCLLSKID